MLKLSVLQRMFPQSSAYVPQDFIPILQTQLLALNAAQSIAQVVNIKLIAPHTQMQNV
jgi:hypothetical protein